MSSPLLASNESAAGEWVAALGGKHNHPFSEYIVVRTSIAVARKVLWYKRAESIIQISEGNYTLCNIQSFNIFSILGYSVLNNGSYMLACKLGSVYIFLICLGTRT
jgi:hypothetical protein